MSQSHCNIEYRLDVLYLIVTICQTPLTYLRFLSVCITVYTYCHARHPILWLQYYTDPAMDAHMVFTIDTILQVTLCSDGSDLCTLLSAHPAVVRANGTLRGVRLDRMTSLVEWVTEALRLGPSTAKCIQWERASCEDLYFVNPPFA